MATNAQIAYRAAAVGLEKVREADLQPLATTFYTWLQAQPTDTAIHVGDAQAALLAAVFAYEGTNHTGSTTDLLAVAARILTDIGAHATGASS